MLLGDGQILPPEGGALQGFLNPTSHSRGCIAGSHHSPQPQSSDFFPREPGSREGRYFSLGPPCLHLSVQLLICIGPAVARILIGRKRKYHQKLRSGKSNGCPWFSGLAAPFAGASTKCRYRPLVQNLLGISNSDSRALNPVAGPF